MKKIVAAAVALIMLVSVACADIDDVQVACDYKVHKQRLMKYLSVLPLDTPLLSTEVSVCKSAACAFVENSLLGIAMSDYSSSLFDKSRGDISQEDVQASYNSNLYDTYYYLVEYGDSAILAVDSALEDKVITAAELSSIKGEFGTFAQIADSYYESMLSYVGKYYFN